MKVIIFIALILSSLPITKRSTNRKAKIKRLKTLTVARTKTNSKLKTNANTNAKINTNIKLGQESIQKDKFAIGKAKAYFTYFAELPENLKPLPQIQEVISQATEQTHLEPQDLNETWYEEYIRTTDIYKKFLSIYDADVKNIQRINFAIYELRDKCFRRYRSGDIST